MCKTREAEGWEETWEGGSLEIGEEPVWLLREGFKVPELVSHWEACQLTKGSLLETAGQQGAGPMAAVQEIQRCLQQGSVADHWVE